MKTRYGEAMTTIAKTNKDILLINKHIITLHKQRPTTGK